ncbi:MAG TPA: tetratricopeptide repeat protein [Myxococcales bacterium LLY-WYZ-16_1]|nr:tetratricopeptide repeat protein [Myxococcales bacterium LLY-WYZ-16_1]
MNTRQRHVPSMALMLCVVLAGLRDASEALASEGDVDYLELAAVLVNDGNYERAETTLQRVDVKDEDTDMARFHVLRGVVRLNLGLYSQAYTDFSEAKTILGRRHEEDPDDNPPPKPILSVYQAQAAFYSKQFEKSLAAFEEADEAADAIPSTYALRAEAHRKLDQPERAWSVLTEGMQRHPDYAELLRRKVFMAIKMGLYRTASDLGRVFLERSQADPSDYLAIGSALYRSGSTDEALKFLELAHLRFPERKDVVVQLVNVYKKKGMYRSAAALLERAAFGGAEDLFADAAELFRLAGDPVRALGLNRRIRDTKARLRQRLATLLELRDYELITAMRLDVERAGLIRDESIRYAVAYAFFKTGEYERSRTLLSGISDPELFRKATELRRVMSKCSEERWKC